VSQLDQGPGPVAPGTLMQKPIPPRMVEPYLTGRRSVISGFVYRLADCRTGSPAELHRQLGLGYDGSDFAPEAREIYMLRWRAISSDNYQVPFSAEHGGDWSLLPPFTGNGFTSADDRSVAQYFTDPMPVPVGSEIHRIGVDDANFIARYDGQVWLRPAEGPVLCATG
jgi:hypothetical protein